MSDAIQKVEAVSLPTTARAILTRDMLVAESEQRAVLAQYVKQQMLEGTDYGKIPGTPKPTLLKPGAEKLVDIFRCTPKFKLMKVVEDFDKGFFNYIFRVQLYQRDAGVVLAEGYGSANSREGRYRWREAQRLCPTCQKPCIITGKKEYGGGYVCFAKKGGCGAKFATGAPEIEKQEVGRVENDDIATMANTILKMAKKRALVDGAIALARCSDMFTQDKDDDVEQPAPPREAPQPSTVTRAEAVKQQLKSRGLNLVDVKAGETEAQAKAREDVYGPLADATPPAQVEEKLSESVQAMAAIAQLQAKFALSGERMLSIIKGATSKSNRAQITLADVEKVKDALDMMTRTAPAPETMEAGNPV